MLDEVKRVLKKHFRLCTHFLHDSKNTITSRRLANPYRVQKDFADYEIPQTEYGAEQTHSKLHIFYSYISEDSSILNSALNLQGPDRKRLSRRMYI